MISATSQSSRFHDTSFATSSIELRNVCISVGTKDLLVDALVQLNDGTKYGLIGRNGVGKSILLTCLANGSLLSPAIRESARIMLIRQALDEETRDSDQDKKNDVGAKNKMVRDELKRVPFGVKENGKLSELEKWTALAEQRSGARGKQAREMVLKLSKMSMDQKQDDDKKDEEMEYMDEEEEEFDEKTLIKALKEVNLDVSLLDKCYEDLSGGWKMRVQLAKASLFAPDLLLLDEPTNHLDIAGIVWLQKMLKEKLADTIIVFVSHNRSFLNEVAEEIILFKNKKLEYYSGNYDQYLQTIEEKQAFADRMQESIDRKKNQMAASIQQNMKLARKHGDDKRLKQVASKKTKMEERIGLERNDKGHRFKLNRDRAGWHATILGDVDHVEDETSQTRLRFSIPEPSLPRSNLPLLVVESLSFRRPNGFQLANITFSVSPGERIAILGANGQGKSTLLNLLAETYTPASGSITRNTSRVGYFQQHIVSQLGSLSSTPLQKITKSYPMEKQETAWSHIGAFGLGASNLATQTPLKSLSGGQRVAFAFAELSFNAPSLLLLDEPNSHLDLDALDALVSSLREFQGGVVFVSHDISFTEQVATSIYWISNGTMVKTDIKDVKKRASKCES